MLTSVNSKSALGERIETKVHLQVDRHGGGQQCDVAEAGQHTVGKIVFHQVGQVGAYDLNRNVARDPGADHCRRANERREQFGAMRRKQSDGGDEKYAAEMNHDRAHEGSRRGLALFGQITGAERNGNEQQGEQGGAGRPHQQVEVMPILECCVSPHNQNRP